MGIQLQLNKGRVPVKIWTEDIDSSAMTQLNNITQLPIVHKHIAAMPDVHAGIGATVGSVIPTKQTIIPESIKNTPPSLPKMIMWALLGLGFIYLLYKSFFYAEPGYIFHVRTVTGNEAVVTEVGYKFYPFGRYNAWKRAMTVQAVSGAPISKKAIRAESDSNSTSASLPPLSIMFLDQVDAHAEATVRFSIPSDEASFLKLAHEYRSPENLLRTALLPAFKETLQANASLMAAEEYYAGGRTEFNSEF